MGKSCQLSAADEEKLGHWIAAHGTPQQVALRCRIVVAAAAGSSDVAIAKQLSVNRHTVKLWRKRFAEEGLDGLWDIAPGRGRKPLYEIGKIAAVVEATLQTKPAGMTHVVGLYLNPPQEAVVLCVDEKSQIQALDRTQPGLPIKKGRCGTMTHDYKRNGTTTLFAALDTLKGRVVGECHSRHRHQEFLKFLRRLDREFPGKVPLHVVMDNYGTHKHQKVKDWLKRHPRFVPHFVPTSSSWLNLVERWFGHLDNKAIRRGVFCSVADLQESIDAFLRAWNQDPKPFVWTATVESIQEKLTRCRQTLEKIQPGCTSPKSRKRAAKHV
jgi:transposase